MTVSARAWPAALLASALLATAPAAWAIDPFEIQVYDGTANDPGQAGIELHVNTVAAGLRMAAPPELPPNHQTHLTAEPSLGLTRWWEVGAYLQTTVRADGGFDYAGTKLRSKFVRPKGENDRLWLGVNVEVSYLPPAYDRYRWGAELRPIVAGSAAGGRFAWAINPILDFGLAGQSLGQAPAFEPALSAVVVWPGRLSAGLELYSDFGPLSGLAPVDEQQHYVFEVVNVLRWRRVEINAGVGEGLTAASNRWVVKAILGFD